ncbi:hypothetical protein V6N11_037835 [Hibiscus sabdariffa]|uniref:Uncharacterized protein n=1 Tax=Hibiscus sabdariffa TaxID=183260 RepID=A0ABR2A3P0_9ROSI
MDFGGGQKRVRHEAALNGNGSFKKSKQGQSWEWIPKLLCGCKEYSEICLCNPDDSIFHSDDVVKVEKDAKESKISLSSLQSKLHDVASRLKNEVAKYLLNLNLVLPWHQLRGDMHLKDQMYPLERIMSSKLTTHSRGDRGKLVNAGKHQNA